MYLFSLGVADFLAEVQTEQRTLTLLPVIYVVIRSAAQNIEGFWGIRVT